ncbi:MAG TPA: SOSS complex subunit B family protein [Thermoplasmata archaeon]|nr:SOSS complex subunit B family protein [Thermoplasmata archaeon]
MSDSTPPRTFISDLRPGRVVTFEATVAKLDPARSIEQRNGGTTQVRNGLLKDATGEVSIVLWGRETELMSVGDEVRVVDGWVKEYKGRPEVSLGRTGRIEKR